MGRVRRNVNGFPRAHDGLLAAEVGFDLAFEDCERFLKVMPMRAWPSARRNHHINKAIAPIGVIARQKNRVGVSHQCVVRQTLVLVRPREHQVSLQIVGRYRRDRLGVHCVLIHKSIRVSLLVTSLISSAASLYLRVSAASFPYFYRSCSRVSRSFFESTPATFSIAA